MRFEPGDVEQARASIEELTDSYEAWRRQRTGTDFEDNSDFSLLLDWKVTYEDGRLDQWSVANVEEFLLHWAPRKVSAPPSWAATAVEAVADGFVFLEERHLLSAGSTPAVVLAAHARSLAAECESRMGDPSNFGMAKSLFAGMGVDFDEDLSPERLNSLMDEFNARPFEQRKAFTDSLMGPEIPEPITIGPVALPSEDEVRAAAAAAPVLAGFRALSDYFEAPGRPLTKTGNIKLADAEALSEILGTEPLEEAVGNLTFRRGSTSRMPQLDHWRWWAGEAGALRVVKSRLVGVKAWRDRCDKDPVGEARKAFEILVDFGPVSSYGMYSLGADEDELIDDLLVPLLARALPRPVEFAELVDLVLDIRDRVGIKSRWTDEDFERSSVCLRLDRLLELVERAGVIVQEDVTHEDSGMFSTRSGGTIRLTAFGIVVTVEQSRLEGVTVETISQPESAQDVADLADDRDGDRQMWWGVLSRWVARQEDRPAAMLEVFQAMASETAFFVLLTEAPPDLVDDLSVALLKGFETSDSDDPLAIASLGWLAERGLLDPGQVDPVVAMRARFSAIGFMAETDPEGIADYWGEGMSATDLIAEIAEISRLMPLNAVALLEAIGKHYPDAAVAKSARREALKVRSRLANQRLG
jgi:hypothetical protein